MTRASHALIFRGGIVAMSLLVAGCITSQSWPVDKVRAERAAEEIPEEQLLDVGIVLFDPGVTEENAEAAEEEGVFLQVRRAEATFVPVKIKNALQGTGNWGMVQIVPDANEPMDLMVSGRILESDGLNLAIQVQVTDATGAVLLQRKYSDIADSSAYRDDQTQHRDPFQNLYNSIANDMLEELGALDAERVTEIRRVARMRFAADLSPDAFGDYIAQDDGQYRLVRLPADGDPMLQRVERIRERDYLFVDTLNEHYANFYDDISEPYGSWRRYSYEEAEALRQVKRSATIRKMLGVGSILGAVAVSNSGNRLGPLARNTMIIGGIGFIKSGLDRGKESKIHADALSELAGSFNSEVAPIVVDVQGRTMELTGTAEEQFIAWRRLMREIYRAETGLETAVMDAQATAPSNAPDSIN